MWVTDFGTRPFFFSVRDEDLTIDRASFSFSEQVWRRPANRCILETRCCAAWNAECQNSKRSFSIQCRWMVDNESDSKLLLTIENEQHQENKRRPVFVSFISCPLACRRRWRRRGRRRERRGGFFWGIKIVWILFPILFRLLGSVQRRDFCSRDRWTNRL